MSTPIAQPSDLELFLGMTEGTINQDRATQIIGFAQTLCESIVYPLPSGAEAVVIMVASRAFSNPQAIVSETVGPFNVNRGANGGLYLTRQDKATLQRLNGGVTAFSIETLPSGTNAVQSITINGSPTGGTFTLSFAGQTTAPISYNATGATVQAALVALSVIQANNVSVSGNGPYIVTFVNDLATTPVPTFVAVSSLTGDPNASITVAVVTVGVYAPGQGLAPWDQDLFTNADVNASIAEV
jgi:hypothetical protein